MSFSNQNNGLTIESNAACAQATGAAIAHSLNADERADFAAGLRCAPRHPSTSSVFVVFWRDPEHRIAARPARIAHPCAVLAPLMAPVVGTALGTVLGSVRFFVRSLFAFLLGSLLVFLIGVAAGMGCSCSPHTGSRQAWRKPSERTALLGKLFGVSSRRYFHYHAMAHEVERPVYPLSCWLTSFIFRWRSLAGSGSGVPHLWPDGLVIYAINLAWGFIRSCDAGYPGLPALTLFGYTLAQP